MDYPIKTVCVVGLGYIGLPTAATLASRGIDVVGVDLNPRVVEAVNAGQPYFSEPDLDMLLRAATTLGKLRATSQPEPADAFIIAVPTPFHEDRSPNLEYIDMAADAIAAELVGMRFRPFGGAEQSGLLSVPKAENDGALRLPTLLQESAETARLFHQRTRAGERIFGAIDPGVVVVAADDPLVRGDRSWNAHDHVVGDHSGAVVYGNDLGVVDAVFLAIVGSHVRENVGLQLAFAIVANGDEVVGKGVVHVITVVALLGVGVFFFEVEELLRERTL